MTFVFSSRGEARENGQEAVRGDGAELTRREDHDLKSRAETAETDAGVDEAGVWPGDGCEDKSVGQQLVIADCEAEEELDEK